MTTVTAGERFYYVAVPSALHMSQRIEKHLK
jgi:hypothetical protein